MSLILTEGFQGGSIPSLLGTKWSLAITNAIDLTNPRWPGLGTQLIVSANFHFTKLLNATQEDDLIVVGTALYQDVFDSSGSTGIWGVRFGSDNGATTHLSFLSRTGGAIAVHRGPNPGTVLGTSALGVLTPSTWHYVEFKARLHDTTGIVVINVDGVEVLNLSGVDTKNAGTKTVFDSIAFGRMGSGCRYTDVYILNEQGSVNNDFLGDSRVHTLFPTADSTPEDWTPSAGTDSFALIDEAAHNSDTDYIEADTATEKTQVALGNLPVTPDSIFGVQVTSTARKDDAGDASYRNYIVSDSNTENGVANVLTTSYLSYADIFELDPDGDVAWVPSAVDALEVGVEVV